MRDYSTLHLDTDSVEQQHLYLSLCKKSLKLQKGNQNPYIEEEQTTQWDVSYEVLQINIHNNTLVDKLIEQRNGAIASSPYLERQELVSAMWSINPS
jgi:hypothetical protein